MFLGGHREQNSAEFKQEFAVHLVLLPHRLAGPRAIPCDRELIDIPLPLFLASASLPTGPTVLTLHPAFACCRHLTTLALSWTGQQRPTGPTSCRPHHPPPPMHPLKPAGPCSFHPSLLGSHKPKHACPSPARKSGPFQSASRAAGSLSPLFPDHTLSHGSRTCYFTGEFSQY